MQYSRCLHVEVLTEVFLGASFRSKCIKTQRDLLLSCSATQTVCVLCKALLDRTFSTVLPSDHHFTQLVLASLLIKLKLRSAASRCVECWFLLKLL